MENEKRLIDANALKALFDEQYDDAFMQYHTRAGKSLWWGVCGGINWGRNTIADAPTVDAVEVVHGRWSMEKYPFTLCSVCGLKRDCEYDFGWNYCPNCGADMRERKDNE